jgi:hypothetical protein
MRPRRSDSATNLPVCWDRPAGICCILSASVSRDAVQDRAQSIVRIDVDGKMARTHCAELWSQTPLQVWRSGAASFGRSCILA